MVIGTRVKISVGVFKGAIGTIRVVDVNNSFLITFDNPALNIDEIHFQKNELEAI